MTNTESLTSKNNLTYYLRLFPPYEENKKLVFNDPDDLCIYLRKVYNKHLQEDPKITIGYQEWVEDYVHVTCIDKEKCPKHTQLFT